MKKISFRATIIAFVLLSLGLGFSRHANAGTTEGVCDSGSAIDRMVIHGNTPIGIAKKIYGNVDWYPVIMKAAGITDPHKLPASTPSHPVILHLPSPCQARQIMASLHVQSTTTVAAIAKPAKPSPAKYFAFARSRSSYSTYLDNNPLNITYGHRTRKWVDGGYASVKMYGGLPYLAFKDNRNGITAAAELLFVTGIYPGMTLEKAIRAWSGNSYGAEILKGTAAGPFYQSRYTTLVSRLPNDAKAALVTAIAQREDIRNCKKVFTVENLRLLANSLPVDPVVVGAMGSRNKSSSLLTPSGN